MAAISGKDLVLSCISKAKVLNWHVTEGEKVKKDKVLATYIFTEKVADLSNFIVQRRLKSKYSGVVLEIKAKPNEEVQRGQVVARLEETVCEHNTVMKDMCCDCQADLRKEPGIPGDLTEPVTANVPVVHNILELRVSVKEAQRLARYDEEQLLKARKLVLVVDLDMTLIHTTVNPVPKDAKDVFSFTLPGHKYEYHTKLRPNARKFLESISKFFELHIFTMGSRMYAHTVAKCLDPDGKFFAHRIRSRDEFINGFSKFHDLKALFPCGDHMVCIIDDREDVWNYTPNLILVKPYKFFKGGDDINDPFKPELTLNDETDKIPEKIPDAPAENNGSEEEVKSALDEVVDKCSDAVENAIQTVNESKANEDESPESKDESPPTAESGNAAAESPESTNQVEPSKQLTAPNRKGLAADLDDYLFYLDEILERVHFYFYSTLDAIKTKGGAARNDPEITKFCTSKTLNPDVRVIVPEIRRLTLKGCNLVFTGVIPTSIPLEKSKPFRCALSLGARVTSDIVDKNVPGGGTTHVVAARLGTKKAFTASRNLDIKLVNPNWLWCASERWEWPEEGIFPVPYFDEKNGRKSPISSRQGTPLHNPFESKNKKQISPLAQEFEIPGGYDPDNVLKHQFPLTTFSKQEIDAMDREVEELMQSGSESDDDDDDDKNLYGSDSTDHSQSSKKRKYSDDSDDDSSETSSKKPSLAPSLANSEKDDENTIDISSDSSSSSSDSSDDEDGEGSEGGDSSNSDSSSSSSDSSSDDEEQLGTLLERRMSESSI